MGLSAINKRVEIDPSYEIDRKIMGSCGVKKDDSQDKYVDNDRTRVKNNQDQGQATKRSVIC